MVSSSEPKFFSLRFEYPATPLRLAKLKACGTIIAMFLVRYGVLHPNISPALFVSLFSGVEAIVDLSAVREYDSTRAAILAGWPETSNDDMSPEMSAVIMDVLNRQVCHILLLCLNIAQLCPSPMILHQFSVMMIGCT